MALNISWTATDSRPYRDDQDKVELRSPEPADAASVLVRGILVVNFTEIRLTSDELKELANVANMLAD